MLIFSFPGYKTHYNSTNYSYVLKKFVYIFGYPTLYIVQYPYHWSNRIIRLLKCTPVKKVYNLHLLLLSISKPTNHMYTNRILVNFSFYETKKNICLHKYLIDNTRKCIIYSLCTYKSGATLVRCIQKKT